MAVFSAAEAGGGGSASLERRCVATIQRALRSEIRGYVVYEPQRSDHRVITVTHVSSADTVAAHTPPFSSRIPADRLGRIRSLRFAHVPGLRRRAISRYAILAGVNALTQS